MKQMVLSLILLTGCAPKQSGNKIEITYQTIETLPEQQAIHREIVAKFEQAHPDIHVNVVYDTSRFQKLNIELAGGAAPDVFYYIVDRLPALARRNVLDDLSANFEQHAAEYYPEVVEPCRIDGKLMMIPFHFSTDVLFFNRDWFARAGEPMPDDTWNWQKFTEVGSRLAKQGQLSFATVLPRALLLVQSFGGAVFTNDRCVVNSPESLAALTFYRLLVERHIAPTAASMEEMEAFDGVNLFRNQKIPLLVGRTYMLTEFDKIEDFHWDVAPVPKEKVRWSRLSVGGNCIWSGTKHRHEAWEFVEFYSTEGAQLAATSRNAIPALKTAAKSAKFPPVMLDALKYSRLDNPWGYAFWDEFNQRAFIEVPEAVALGEIVPANALLSIDEIGNGLIARQ